MKKLNLIFLFLILLTSLVIAVRYESNLFREATLTDAGYLITNNPISNVSLQGYICADSNCSSFSGDLWSGATLFTENDSIILDYPSTLLSSYGYGVYVFKPGYLPFEIASSWFGTDSSDPLGPYTSYLAKKENCISNISNLTLNQNNSNLEVLATIHAPINHSGPLNGVPTSLQSYYQSSVNLVLIINDSTEQVNELKVIILPFSEKNNTRFNSTLPNGNYTLTLTTKVNDNWCINSPSYTLTRNISISNINQSSGNQTNSTNQSLPYLNIISPTQTNYNTTSILVNIQYENASTVLFETGFVNQTYTSPTFISLPEGNHTFKATAINSLGNTTQQVNFSIILNNSTNITNTTNQSLPIINILSPINQTYNYSSILINISAQNASAIFFNINNGTNQTYTSPINLTFPFGINILNAFAINSAGTSKTNVTFVVVNLSDNLPPNTISNLTVIERTANSLTWSWNNPNNSDFSHNILYLNGINSINTSNQSYRFTGLQSDTQYNLTVNTVDFTGNINNTPVTNITRTLSPNNNDNNGGSNSGKNKKSSFALPSIKNIQPRYNNSINETIRLESPKEKVSIWSGYNLIILIGLIVLLILIILIIFIKRN